MSQINLDNIDAVLSFDIGKVSFIGPILRDSFNNWYFEIVIDTVKVVPVRDGRLEIVREQKLSFVESRNEFYKKNGVDVKITNLRN